ncbi:helix-turn-helix domain containing protein [Salinicola corii]|uniref:Helix-turn-helix domain containing protein n=1 Tax=Salinicola corii TaxID=2606937 RepID=A0A640WFH5_9GAMM|nr:helix-turn-helix domain containing protein [Salinicola corii]
MKTGRPATPIVLTEAERIELTRRAHQRKGSFDSRIRAEIILACANGESGVVIAQRLGIGVHTVSRWRVRFGKWRLKGLNDGPRSGRPRSISDEQVQEVIDRTTQTRPEDASHWTTRRMGKIVGISPASVQRIWQSFGLEPHRGETAKLLESARRKK